MIEIVIPAPPDPRHGRSELPPRATVGRLGVLDNSKPGFGMLARAAMAELARQGFAYDSGLYVKKPLAGQPADRTDIDRLASGAVAVLVGSGD